MRNFFRVHQDPLSSAWKSSIHRPRRFIAIRCSLTKKDMNGSRRKSSDAMPPMGQRSKNVSRLCDRVVSYSEERFRASTGVCRAKSVVELESWTSQPALGETLSVSVRFFYRSSPRPCRCGSKIRNPGSYTPRPYTLPKHLLGRNLTRGSSNHCCIFGISAGPSPLLLITRYLHRANYKKSLIG